MSMQKQCKNVKGNVKNVINVMEIKALVTFFLILLVHIRAMHQMTTLTY